MRTKTHSTHIQTYTAAILEVEEGEEGEEEKEEEEEEEDDDDDEAKATLARILHGSPSSDSSSGWRSPTTFLSP